MQKLYEFYVDCGSMGDLEGLFIAEDTAVDNIIGELVDFGECLGKHSEIMVDIELSHIKTKSEDPTFIAQFIDVMGAGTISGYNPLDYYDPEEDEDDAND